MFNVKFFFYLCNDDTKQMNLIQHDNQQQPAGRVSIDCPFVSHWLGANALVNDADDGKFLELSFVKRLNALVLSIMKFA